MAYQDHLDGELLAFTYQAADGSFAVAKVRGKDGVVVVVGPIGHLPLGVNLSMQGRYDAHPKFGKRFKVQQVLVDNPKTLTGLQRYLASGAVAGFGDELARRAVETFGLRLLQVLDDDPEQLLQVKGIGKKRLEEIVGHWKRDRVGREVAVLLQGHGLGPAIVNRVVERYGERAMAVISSDPYRLAAEITGVAFKTADQIARAVGIAVNDPRRANAAVRWLLLSAEDDGHCFLPQEELERRGADLGLNASDLAGAIQALILKGRVVRKAAALPGHEQIYRGAMERREAAVAKALRQRAGPRGGAGAVVEQAEQKVGLELNEDQRQAVLTALTHGVAIITGGPGTGKTTIVKVLMKAAALRKEDWVLCAPTGRAARRLQESCGKEGKTLHRLLEYSMQTRSFLRNADKPLQVDGVLVDEASMVDLELMEALCEALPTGARLVLVGDADQLPSVGAGQVLADCIASGTLAVSTLHQVYRQAQDSGIVRNAWRIQAGQEPVSSEKDPQEGLRQDFFLVPRLRPDDAVQTLIKVVQERLPKLGFDPLVDVQVLTPMHRGPLGSIALNAALQAALNPTGESFTRGNKTLRVGDRVIQTRNDYDNDIFNGDVGRIHSMATGGVEVDFDGRKVALVGEQVDQLELAYAISIHKSQGSEYPAVLVMLDTSHFVMLRRNLVYTGVTRAQRFCAVVGNPRALRIAVEKDGGGERYTGLAQRLAQSQGEAQG